jgi:serine/threonine protein kinase/Tfp pilus assembly protein PilF
MDSPQLKTIFSEALVRQDGPERAAYLDEACRGDAGLRAQVETLLDDHGRIGRFLETAAGTIPSAGHGLGEPRVGEITEAQTPDTCGPAGPGRGAEGPGSTIGPYKLLQQIGEGGMGTVYMAQQAEPVRRRVALKVIKAGMDSRQVVARFEAERQALAMMDHVNIARVLDAGATESGQPYFVMELVHGVPITNYCDDNRLTPRQRLELFVPVCQAIQHAHQKGIIHRDLKPSNVMVTLCDGKPVPKVIDFGVAKATEQNLTERTLFTQYGTLVGTLEYMSPEQAEMSVLGVDTRSDIYSLGVLLYELLTSNTPLRHKTIKDAAYAEILRMIKEEEPPRPSTRLSDSGEALASISANRHMEPAKLTRLMRGELDWIVMKTLEKDRNRRYETAKDFAADVQRYLDDEAVQACPPSAGYRFRKFVRRNKRMLATAGMIALALVLGIAASVWQAIRATDAEGLAEERLEAASANYQTAEAQRQRAEASERDARMKEGLAKDAQKASVESLKDALAAVDLMLTRVADDRLLNVPQMEPIRRDLLQDSLKFYQRFLANKSDDPVIRRETALAYRRVGGIHRTFGQYPEAENAYRSAIAMLEELGVSSALEPALRVELVSIHLEFGWTLAALGKGTESVQSVRNAVQVAENLAEQFPHVDGYRAPLLNSRTYLANCLTATHPEEAEKILRRSLLLADDAFSLEGIHRYLGVVLSTTRRLPEAEAAFREAVKHAEKMATEAPSANWLQDSLAVDLRLLAGALAANQRPAEADEYVRRAILILDKLATDFPAGPGYRHNLANTQVEYAGLLKRLGRPAEAEKAYRLALDLFVKLSADFPTMNVFPQTAFDQRLNLGRFLVEAGRAEDALDIYGQAIDLPGKLAADVPTKMNHWRGLVRTHVELGRLLLTAGKKPEAEAAFGRVVSIQEKLEKNFGANPEHRRELASSHTAAAELLRDAGRTEYAEKVNHFALTHWQKLVAKDPDNLEYLQNLAESYGRLGALLESRGRVREAEEAFLRAIEIRAKHLALTPGDAQARMAQGHSRRKVAYVIWQTSIDRLPEAEKHFRAALLLIDALHAEFPDNAEYWDFLAETHRCLGRILGAMYNPLEAEKALRQAIELDEQRAAKLPETSEARWKWSLEYYSDLASQLVAGGRTREAKEVFLQAAARFSKTIERDRKKWWTWSNRGEVYAELGEWNEAEADFAKAVKLAPERAHLHYRRALAGLALVDSKGYHDACADMVMRFWRSTDLETAYWSAWTCALAPDAVTDWQPVVRLAKEGLAADPKNYNMINTVGAMLYRAGRFNEAAERLTEAEAAFEQTPGTRTSIVYNWLFQAMAHHRLGHTVEAASWLEKSMRALDEPSPKVAQAPARIPWNQRLTLMLLRREAQELLAKKQE